MNVSIIDILYLVQENPCEHPIVILKDVRYCDLESLLKYMYAGQVHIKQDQLGRWDTRGPQLGGRLGPLGGHCIAFCGDSSVAD